MNWWWFRLRVRSEQHRDVGRVERAARQHRRQGGARVAPRFARCQRQRYRSYVMSAANNNEDIWYRQFMGTQ